LTENTLTPTGESPRAAGLALHSACDAVVPAREKVLMSTDLQIELPEGCYSQIAPCSRLALQHHMDIGGGIVDKFTVVILGVYTI